MVLKIMTHSPRTAAVAVLLALACMLSPPAYADEQSVYVVINPETGVDNLDSATLRAIFSMRLRQWPNGQPIRVYTLPDRNPVHLTFCKKILRIFPFVLRDQWDRLTFTGTGRPPTVAKNEAELLAHIRQTPGAIGYTSRPSEVVTRITISDNQVASQTQLSLLAD